jgi:hypothetical protein
MIGFIKRLWRDRRGNALVIAGAALPFLIGAAGLATDTIQWAMWKRELQRAADSAAYAGVYARVQDNAGMTASQAVDLELGTQKTNSTWVASELLGSPQISFPTGAGYTNGVQVTIAIKKRLGFSSLFLSEAPTITATGAAALFESDSFCVVALAPEGSALIIGGSANVTMGCGAISNSTDPIEAVGTNGNAHNFVADPVAAVGGIEGTINGSPNLEPYHIAQPDPYEGISTTVPPAMTCTNYNHASKTNADGSKAPGCYNNFNPPSGGPNTTVTLSPGVYYLDNTDLSLSGQTRLVGEGVTIILTGSSPGSVTMSGNSSIDLTAPTTGEYANLVLIQSPNAATGNNNTINGDNNTLLDGAVYFPKGDLTFTGSTGQAFQCAMVVGYTVEFTGNATVQNDTSSCDADTQVAGWKVRLIA